MKKPGQYLLYFTQRFAFELKMCELNTRWRFRLSCYFRFWMYDTIKTVDARQIKWERAFWKVRKLHSLEHNTCIVSAWKVFIFVGIFHFTGSVYSVFKRHFHETRGSFVRWTYQILNDPITKGVQNGLENYKVNRECFNESS